MSTGNMRKTRSQTASATSDNRPRTVQGPVHLLMRDGTGRTTASSKSSSRAQEDRLMGEHGTTPDASGTEGVNAERVDEGIASGQRRGTDDISATPQKMDGPPAVSGATRADGMIEGAPTEIIEHDVDQQELIRRAKDQGIKVRDFAYEMKPYVSYISPGHPDDADHSASQDDPARYKTTWPIISPAPKIVSLGSLYTSFRILRDPVFDSDLGNLALPIKITKGETKGEILTRFELIALIKFGWVKLIELDWIVARQHLGNALISYAQYPIEMIPADTLGGRRAKEIEIRKDIKRFPLKQHAIPWDREGDRLDLEQYGPFGSGLLHLVSKETQELMYEEIVKADAEGEGAKEDLSKILERKDGQVAVALFKPILDRLRAPYEPRVTDLEPCPTEPMISNDDNTEQGPDSQHVGGTGIGMKRSRESDQAEAPQPSTHNEGDAQERSPKRQRVDTTSVPTRNSAPSPLAPASPGCTRTLRSRTYRTDLVYQPKRRTRKKADEPSKTDSKIPHRPDEARGRGKKRARNDGVYEHHSSERPNKRPTLEPLFPSQMPSKEPKNAEEPSNLIVRNRTPVAEPLIQAEQEAQGERTPDRQRTKATKEKGAARFPDTDAIPKSSGPGPSSANQPGSSNATQHHPPHLAHRRAPLGLGGLRRTATFAYLGEPSRP